MATLCTKIDASFSNDVTVTPHILHVSSDAKKIHPLKGNLESRARGWRQTSFPVLSPVLKLPTPTQYFPRRLLFFIALPPVSPWGHSSPVFFSRFMTIIHTFSPFFCYLNLLLTRLQLLRLVLLSERETSGETEKRTNIWTNFRRPGEKNLRFPR